MINSIEGENRPIIASPETGNSVNRIPQLRAYIPTLRPIASRLILGAGYIAIGMFGIDSLRPSSVEAQGLGPKPTSVPSPTPNPDTFNLSKEALNALIDKGIDIGVKSELKGKQPASPPAPAVITIPERQEGFHFGEFLLGGVVAAMAAIGTGAAVVALVIRMGEGRREALLQIIGATWEYVILGRPRPEDEEDAPPA